MHGGCNRRLESQKSAKLNPRKECDCMKRTNQFVVIASGACAVIWVIKVILDVVNETIYDPSYWIVVNILCAALWIACFVVNLKRYLSDQNEQ